MWGWMVQWCLLFDGSGDFCKFCAVVSRAWHLYILHRNPCMPWMPLDKEKPPTEAGG